MKLLPISLRWRQLPLAALFFGYSIALSADVMEMPSITLAEAVARTLTRSPELESYTYAIRAAEAERIQAGLRPNPELGVQFEDFAGTGNLRGARGLETTLSLSQVLELGDKRQRRSDAAAMQLGLIEADYDIKKLDVLAEVARRFIHAVTGQALLEVAQAALEQAERTQDAVQVRVSAARAMSAELSKAEIAVARAHIALEHREHELKSSKRRLAAIWGEDRVQFQTVVADLFTLPPVADIEQLLERIRTSPDLQRFLSVQRLRAAELELARARSTPDARIGAGLRRLEDLDDQAFMLTFSIGLPVNDRNQGNIQAARERLAQVESDEHARYIDAQSVLFSAYQELLHAATEAETLHTTLIPAAERALADYEKAYQTGRLSYLELVDAQRELIELRSEAILAAADYHRYLIEIERLTGERFTTEGGE